MRDTMERFRDIHEAIVRIEKYTHSLDEHPLIKMSSYKPGSSII
jgi:hypothetical protein